MARPDPRRLMFFEQAREQAEREFKANNKDAMVGAPSLPPPPPPPPPPPAGEQTLLPCAHAV